MDVSESVAIFVLFIFPLLCTKAMVKRNKMVSRPNPVKLLCLPEPDPVKLICLPEPDPGKLLSLPEPDPGKLLCLALIGLEDQPPFSLVQVALSHGCGQP